MPPKSNKKEPKTSWFNCEKCNRKITSDQLTSGNHGNENLCEEFGVLNESFTTKKVICNLPKEVDESSSTFLQRFLFVPETICNFCNFTMDCNLLIEINEKFYVRKAWPITDVHLDLIYTNSTGCYNFDMVSFIKLFIFRTSARTTAKM